MRVFQHLQDQHRLIAGALDRAEAAIAPLNAEGLHAVIELFVNFVDRVHHTEEEMVVFEALRDHGEELILGPLAVLEREHGVTRAHLKHAMEALPKAARGDREALGLCTSSMRAYIDLVRAHLAREEELFYPIAAKLLASREPELQQRMAEIDWRVMVAADLARWRQLAGVDPSVRLERLEIPEVRPGPPGTAVSEPSTSAQLDARLLAVGPSGEGAGPREDAGAGALYDDGEHRVLLLHDYTGGLSVQANQYLIVSSGKGMILDPGGPKIYSRVFTEMQRYLAADALEVVFLSHQDPDVGTSLNAWLMDTDATAYVSRLWIRFLPHYGIDKLLRSRLTPIPDEGMSIRLGREELLLVPAHFLHSPGNFQVYDRRSRTLFSGDLGAGLEADYTVVEDFDAHAKLMTGFHRRYMASRRAMRAWVERVRALDIETIAPQHGAVFRGREMVRRFLAWCWDLECGVDLLP